ncbi:MAG: TonB-dependent receptor, partial [Pseudomonadales bacterium]
LAIGLAIASTASAQSVLEEVVVTAQKREQNVQDVPIAITAFTGAQMNALGVKQSIDIAAFTPGVHISGNLAGQNTQFSIRGVTQNDFNDIIEAPNAVYLDEGYLAIAQAQTFAVFDIDRVEILKGPQGTLFGRNATGGLVHYVSNKPSFEETSGYLDLNLGRFDTDADANRFTVEGAVGGPLTDTVAGRLAFRYNKQDGYLKNLYPDSAFLGSPGEGAGADLGDDDTFAGRLSLAFRPSDTLQIDLSVNYAKTDVATGPYQSKSTVGIVENGELINVIDTPANETRLTIDTAGGDGGADAIDGDGLLPGGGIGLPGRLAPGGDFFGYTDPDGDDFTFSSDFAFEDQGSTETTGINARVEWELADGLLLTSVTDFKDYEKLLFIDVDSAPANQLANYAGVDATSFTQEFRLNGETDRSRWVAGFFYLTIDNESDNGLKAPVNSIAGSPPFSPVDIGVVADLQTDSYSLFGQLDYDLTDTVSVTVGLRVIQEEKEYNMGIGIFPSLDNFSVNQGDFIPNAFGAGSPYFFSADTSDTLWAGKIQFDWRPSDDLLLYAGVNRGVKAGSFNAPLLGAFLGAGGDPSIPYDEEILTAFEGGFKATFGDGTTRLNGSVFFYDYSDYQAFLFVGVGGVVINADAETYGFELELQSSPMEGLDLMLSMSYFDAEVKDLLLRNGSPLPPRDVDPTYAPELQVTGLVRYAWSALGGTVALQGDISYSDEYFYNLRNFDADKFDSYVMLNTQLSWKSSSEQWEANLAIRNLSDERAGIQGFDLATLCGCNEVSYRAPRAYSVGLRYNF